LGTVQQDVGAADVVVARQQRAEPGQHAALGVELEHLVAPEPANQVGGVAGAAGGLVGGGQGHGALGGLRIAAAEPGDHALGVEARDHQGLLGGVLATLARGQPDRSRRAWSSSKKLMLSAPASTRAHRAILRDSGSWMLDIAMRIVAGSRLVTAMRRLAASASAGVA
jgi:hypothetical protein